MPDVCIIRLIVLMLISIVDSNQTNDRQRIMINVTFIDNGLNYTPSITEFRMNTNKSLTINFDQLNQQQPNIIDIQLQCRDNELCEIVNRQLYRLQFDHDHNYHTSINVTILAHFLGHTYLDIMQINDNNINHSITTFSTASYPLSILRTSTGHFLSRTFTAVATVIIVFMTFMMGTQLNITVISDVIRRPIGPFIGFGCQYLLMPITAFILAYFVVPVDQIALKLALFAVGCSPGGGKSNFWTIIFDGNLDLSVAMTFCSTVAAMGMMPFWLNTLGRNFFDGEIKIPFLSLLETLLTMTVPLVIGTAFIQFKPHLAARFHKFIKAASWALTVIFGVVGILTNLFIFRLITWYVMVCGCALPWIGYTLAYIISWLFGQSHRDRITTAIETGIQHIGIAIIVMRFSLPEPDVDLALVMPIAVVFFTDKPLIIVWFIRLIYRKYFKNDKVSTETCQQKGTVAVVATADAAVAVVVDNQVDQRKLSTTDDNCENKL